jgi:murein DD-endopeptidase MepM/ murein hydrolase activator NlpD
VLLGLVAGSLTASTAFSSAGVHRPSPRSSAQLAAVTLVASDRDGSAAGVADLRVQEAAIAEWNRRIAEPLQPSRSTNTPGSLLRPASGARTGWFGEGRRSHRHTGIDFDGETGDPVVAAGSGTVVHAGWAPEGYAGYGQMVLIDHGNGVQTLYAHLSRIRVHVGQVLDPGEGIGAIGTTGSVTGSHLHFEVRLGGRPVNPAPWLAGG